MRKQVLRKGFLVLILVLSFNEISYSQSENDQTVSTDASEFFPDSAPESKQETDHSPGDLSLPSTEGAPVLESEDQSLSPDQYANGTAPEHVEEPDVFSPELYSPSPFPESLGTKSELESEVNGSDSQIKNPTAAPATDFTLPETEAVSAEPDAINNSQIVSTEPVSSTVLLPGEYNSKLKAPESAPSTNFPEPETKAVSDKPQAEIEVDDYESQIKSSASVPSTVVTVPETNVSSADGDSSPVKSSASAPSEAIELPETVVASPTLLSSFSSDNYTEEEADNQSPQSIVDDYNNMPTETAESAAPSENSTLPKADTETAQESSPAEDIDEGVDMPPMANTPSVFPSNYRAEDETIDIVHEEDNGTWGSWHEQNYVVVAGVIIGVCFVGLAGIVFNNKKNKKKTEFQYQPLYKGV